MSEPIYQKVVVCEQTWSHSPARIGFSPAASAQYGARLRDRREDIEFDLTLETSLVVGKKYRVTVEEVDE